MDPNDENNDDQEIEDFSQTQMTRRRKFLGGIFLLCMLAYIFYIILAPVPTGLTEQDQLALDAVTLAI